ncbi:MAG: hypothetical protein RLZZ127_2883, partial [Planctomycetota bacterium]
MWRRLANLGLLGLASGLPYQVPGDLLRAWMKDHGADIAVIGVTSLLALPYSL